MDSGRSRAEGGDDVITSSLEDLVADFLALAWLLLAIFLDLISLSPDMMPPEEDFDEEEEDDEEDVELEL